MEKVNLTAASLTDLYKKNLVIIQGQDEKNVKKGEPIPVIYTGNYKQKILWLHTEPLHPNISNEDHEMVSKILDACRLSWDDIALVNLHQANQNPEQIIQILTPMFVIFSDPSFINNVTHDAIYQVNESAGVKKVYTDRLSDIRQDKNLKVRFWQALKNMFQL